MNNIKRFGVSIEKPLLEKFDDFIKSKNYPNRSEALRDLIRKKFVEEKWLQTEEEAAGVIILVYDHHKRKLIEHLIDIQHDYSKIIISTQYIHLNNNIYLELIAVKGKIKEIYKLNLKLKSINGIKYISLAKSTLAKEI